MKIIKSNPSYLLLSLFIASYVALSGGVIAQTLGGGAGGSGTLPSPSGGLDTVSGAPNNGFDLSLIHI